MRALEELVGAWLAEADVLERYGDQRVAEVLRLHAAEVREAVRASESELLTLTEAAAESGYSEDWLRHLVANGKVPNAGRKGAPRIRRVDLPLKGEAPPATPSSATRRILEAIEGGAA